MTLATATDTAELVARFARIPTANIGDSMDRMGCMIGIDSVWPGAQLAGTAYTVWTRAGDNAKIHEAIALAGEGDVIVVNGEGDITRALLGEMMGERAKKRGIRGFVVDGMVRDAGGLRDLGVPTFARGVTPAGPYKFGPGRLAETIACGGVAIAQGDIVIGDDDGIVVIPLTRAGEIIVSAEKKYAQEVAKRELF